MAYKREWQRPLELDRPTWDMLRENNIYTDSRRDFRWRHCPDKENGVIHAAVYTVMSYEYADDVQEKDFSEAQKCLMKALSLEPESTKIISNLGYLALAQGNKQEARNYFTAVLEYDPKDKIAASELMKLERSED